MALYENLKTALKGHLLCISLFTLSPAGRPLCLGLGSGPRPSHIKVKCVACEYKKLTHFDFDLDFDLLLRLLDRDLEAFFPLRLRDLP